MTFERIVSAFLERGERNIDEAIRPIVPEKENGEKEDKGQEFLFRSPKAVHNINPDNIKAELKRAGFTVRKYGNITHKGMKGSLGFFFRDTPILTGLFLQYKKTSAEDSGSLVKKAAKVLYDAGYPVYVFFAGSKDIQLYIFEKINKAIDVFDKAEELGGFLVEYYPGVFESNEVKSRLQRSSLGEAIYPSFPLLRSNEESGVKNLVQLSMSATISQISNIFYTSKKYTPVPKPNGQCFRSVEHDFSIGIEHFFIKGGKVPNILIRIYCEYRYPEISTAFEAVAEELYKYDIPVYVRISPAGVPTFFVFRDPAVTKTGFSDVSLYHPGKLDYFKERIKTGAAKKKVSEAIFPAREYTGERDIQLPLFTSSWVATKANRLIDVLSKSGVQIEACEWRGIGYIFVRKQEGDPFDYSKWSKITIDPDGEKVYASGEPGNLYPLINMLRNTGIRVYIEKGTSYWNIDLD